MYTRPSIALVTTSTRLSGLLAKFGTKGAARFKVKARMAKLQIDEELISNSFGDFDLYEVEDDRYNRAVDAVSDSLSGLGLNVVDVPRKYLATYDFRHTELIVVIGPDGLVANTAKYVGGIPIVAVNPDPDQIDGVLLPFAVQQARRAVVRTLERKAKFREVTLGRVQLTDGQTMLAFNDFFIGRRTHASARYVLYDRQSSEVQSSSGLIVATGAGSTGWLSSIFNMSRGVANWVGGSTGSAIRMDWGDRKLAWVVREPFQSRSTGTEMITGMIDQGKNLRVESLMPESGVIFSDGIENDCLEFNSGAIAEIGIADQRAKLVV